MSERRSKWIARIACVGLACSTPAAPLVAQRPGAEPTVGVSAYLVVIASRLNVRAGPSLDAEIVGGVTRGEKLCVVAYDDDWADVVTPVAGARRPDPLRGFVSRGFVSETRTTRDELAALGCPV